MKFELMHPADQIVAVMERIYRYGMTTTSGGNLSVMDDDGDIWITPASIDKGSLTRRDIVCVKPDGTVVGIHKPSSELPFHRTIYQRRGDVRAVVHAHPPFLVAFSIVGRLPSAALLPNVGAACGELGMAGYGLPGSIELGNMVAAVFERGHRAVMLENHGVVVADGSLFRAFQVFETLDFSARAEVSAIRLGGPVAADESLLRACRGMLGADLPEFVPAGHGAAERDARRELAALTRRAYDQQLFTSAQGTISQRLGEDAFLIAPDGVDRRTIEPDDFVVVNAGRREAGKVPGCLATLHRRIYRCHPHVQSVITAQPPSLMAFAVTGAAFDSRTIPESYIMLRNVVKHPLAAAVADPAGLAELFVSSTPVALVGNGCAVSTGTSPINAFDRLEVGEYSARAIVATGTLGTISKISDAEVKDIDVAFHLE